MGSLLHCRHTAGLLKFNKINSNMSYKFPLKQAQNKTKWITIALIGVYACVAIFIVINQ